MATTLINVVNDVLISTWQRGNKTAIAQTDSTAYIRDQLNKALRKLYKLKPFVVDADGTVTITPSTRTFAGPVDTELQNIYPWSFRINDPNGDIPVSLVTEEYIIENYPKFETDEADKPRFIYFSNGLIAIYPLLEAGSSNLTLQFKYSTQFTKITSTSATFPFEDESDELEYCRLYAQLEYEVMKGLGQPAVTNDKLVSLWAVLTVKHMKGKRTGFISNRRYGR
jgi:hypothetical protein